MIIFFQLKEIKSFFIGKLTIHLINFEGMDNHSMSSGYRVSTLKGSNNHHKSSEIHLVPKSTTQVLESLPKPPTNSHETLTKKGSWQWVVLLLRKWFRGCGPWGGVVSQYWTTASTMDQGCTDMLDNMGWYCAIWNPGSRMKEHVGIEQSKLEIDQWYWYKILLHSSDKAGLYQNSASLSRILMPPLTWRLAANEVRC